MLRGISRTFIPKVVSDEYIKTSFVLYVLGMEFVEACLLIAVVIVILVFIVRKVNLGLRWKSRFDKKLGEDQKSNFIYPEVAPVPWSSSSGQWRYPCPDGGRCPWEESGWWWPQAQKYFW